VSRARVLLHKPDPDTEKRKDQLQTDPTPVIPRGTSHAFIMEATETLASPLSLSRLLK
jgi:hypothetical protein